MRNNIFLSYCWKDDDVVDEIDDYFKRKQIIFMRDKRNIDSWGSIKSFMNEIEKSDYAILVISDNYLKSKNCMYEVLELMKDEGYRNKIITVVLDNAFIYSAIGKAKYIEYWNEEYNKISNKINKINDNESCTSLQKELIIVRDIKNNIGEFISIVSDMNNPNINDICEEISKKLYNRGLYIELREIDELKKQFINHYDEKLTPPSKDVKYIIDELIKHSKPNCIKNFLLFAYKKRPLKGRTINITREKSFWEYVINSRDEVLRKEFLAFLRENFEEALFFILMQPTLLKEFLNEDELLWKLINENDLTQLFEFNYNNDNLWIVITELLQLDILKPTENINKKNEIFRALEYVYGRREIIPTESQRKILIESGFLNFLEEYIFRSSYFDYPDGINYANDKYRVIKFYLENKENVNKDIIKNIKKIYDKVYFGSFCDMMTNVIDNNERVKKIIYRN